MKASLFTVYDEVADLFSSPVIHRNEAVAVRWFNQTITKSNTPSDYKLYKIGEFDEDTGIITASTQPLLILKGGASDGE